MDMEKVIKELHDARRYLEDKEWSDRGASPHIDAINNTLALLKEQDAVVRCVDCKHNARCEIAFGCNGNREWYCADGEMKPTQTNAKNNALE
jgi:hypothetical protein